MMNTFFGSSFEQFLLRIQQTFEENTGQKWMELALGWVLQAGPKTVAGMLRAVNGIRSRAFSAYYAMLRSQWFDLRQYWNTIQGILLEGIDEGRIRLIVDDTVLPKVGREIAFCKWHKEFHGETARDNQTVYGQKWVVLAVLWEQPFGVDTVVSLPVQMAVLTEATTPLELGREMVNQIRRDHPKRSFLVMGDRSVGGRPFLWPIPERLDGLVRLKKNAALYEIPGAYQGRGAPRKKGKRIPTPEELASDESLEWTTMEVARYGQTEQVEVYTTECLWYRVTHDVPGRLVIVRDVDTPENWMALYSTDATMDPKEMIELYCFRWKIETLFREAKQYGGLGDAQCRTEESVKRVAPFVMGLVSLVKYWFLCRHEELMDEIRRDDWEQERECPSFQIMVQTLRWTIRKKQFSQKMGDDPSLEKKMQDLFNQWTRAA